MVDTPRTMWRTLWERLTRPASTIQGEEQRHQAVLLAALMIAVLLFAVIGVPIWILSSPQFTAPTYIGIGTIAACGVIYILSRTRYYYVGATLVPLLILCLVGLTLATAPVETNLHMLALSYIPVAVILASILKGTRFALGIGVLSALNILTSFFVPGVPFPAIFSYLVLLGLISALTIVSAQLRHNYVVRLAEQKQQLDAFFAQSLDGFFFMMLDKPIRWDNSVDKEAALDYVFAHQRITRVNSAMLAQYGASLDEFLKLKPNDFFAHDIEYGRRVWRQLFDAGRLHIETSERKLDGTPMWVEGEYACFYDAQGRITGHFGVQRDVTERKQVESALRMAEARYRGLFEQSHDAVFILDLEGRHVAANHRAATMLGYTDNEILGLTIADLSAELPETLKLRDRLINGETIPLFVRRFRKKNGEVIPGEVNVELIRDADGKPLHIQSVVRDISRRTAMQAALHESEIRYRSIVTAVAEGIVLHDSQGNIQTCNAAAEHILGLTHDQLIGLTPLDPLWQAIHEDGSPFFGDTRPAMVTLRTGVPQRNVVMGVTKPDGSLTWISINTQPLILPNATQPYAVVASFTDVTERKRAEDALLASERRQRALLSAIPDLMFRVHRDGTFLDYHAGDPSRLAVPPEQFLGRKLDEVLPAYMAQGHATHVEEVLSAGVEAVYEYPMPVEDQVFHFEARMVACAKDEVVTIVRDITERKHLEAQTLALTAEKQRIEIMEQFVQNASHELRTPLAVIRSSLYLLVKSIDDQAHHQQVEQLDQQFARLSRLVDMLLVMTELDTDVPFDRRPTDVNTLLAHLVAAVRSKVGKKVLTVDFAPDQTLPPLKADVDWLIKAFEQLLDNAIRFTPDGGAIMVRTYRHTHRTDCTVIEIRDTGIGISPDVLPQVFKRFWRQDEAHTTPGFGLGLSIAQRIIEQHGGAIEAESMPGRGSVFKVLLPLGAESQRRAADSSYGTG